MSRISSRLGLDPLQIPMSPEEQWRMQQYMQPAPVPSDVFRQGAYSAITALEDLLQGAPNLFAPPQNAAGELFDYEGGPVPQMVSPPSVGQQQFVSPPAELIHPQYTADDYFDGGASPADFVPFYPPNLDGGITFDPSGMVSDSAPPFISLPPEGGYDLAEPERLTGLRAFLSDAGGVMSSLLGGQSRPDPYAANAPSPTTFESLAGIAAALLGGGGGFDGFAYRAGDISMHNQGVADRRAVLSTQLANAGPAGQLRKQQQDIYKSRMVADVNRFVAAKSRDVNNTVSPDQWEQAWQQIRSTYTPLGLDPGPSPYELEWSAARAASPEIQNMEIVTKLREQYGDGFGSLAEAHLSRGGDPLDLMKLQIDADKIKAVTQQQRQTIQQREQKDLIKRIEKDIEAERERDIRAYENFGVANEQKIQGASAGFDSFTPSYQRGVEAIHAYHDRRKQQVRQGIEPTDGVLFGGEFRAPTTPEQFNATTNNLINRAYPQGVVDVSPQAAFGGRKMSTPDGDEIIVYSPTATKIPPMTADEKKRAMSAAVNANDPSAYARAVATADRQNVSILVQKNGDFFLLPPDRL